MVLNKNSGEEKNIQFMHFQLKLWVISRILWLIVKHKINVLILKLHFVTCLCNLGYLSLITSSTKNRKLFTWLINLFSIFSFTLFFPTTKWVDILENIYIFSYPSSRYSPFDLNFLSIYNRPICNMV